MSEYKESFGFSVSHTTRQSSSSCAPVLLILLKGLPSFLLLIQLVLSFLLINAHHHLQPVTPLAHRAPREGEVDGQAYNFVSQEQMKQVCHSYVKFLYVALTLHRIITGNRERRIHRARHLCWEYLRYQQGGGTEGQGERWAISEVGGAAGAERVLKRKRKKWIPMSDLFLKAL